MQQHLMTIPAKGRITKDLGNGVVAVLQVVDTKERPKIAKRLERRAKTSKTYGYIAAAEAAMRVAKIVFMNAIKKGGKK